MPDPVEIAFRGALDALVPEGSSLLAAVSGGGDSVALLHLLRRFAKRKGLRITVAHLDHGLRRGSRADRLFVERLAAALELPCVTGVRAVRRLRRRDESPEEASRRVRREFLLETAEEVGASLIVTGHTLDDQAETILMRLARGAGPRALAGMSPSGPGPFVRPLLSLSRAEIREWLGRRTIAWRDDPSNRSLRFDRNRVRRLVMPVLAEALNPRAAHHLVEAAARLREDAAYLDLEAAAIFDRLAVEDRSGRITLTARDLAALPGPLAGRVAHAALRRAGCDPRRVGGRHVAALLALAAGTRRRTLDLPSGRCALRDDGRLVLGEKTPSGKVPRR